jgi:hypothetical protein
MRLGAAERWNGHHVEAKPARTGCFGGDASEVIQALLALAVRASVNQDAGGSGVGFHGPSSSTIIADVVGRTPRSAADALVGLIWMELN